MGLYSTTTSRVTLLLIGSCLVAWQPIYAAILRRSGVAEKTHVLVVLLAQCHGARAPRSSSYEH